MKKFYLITGWRDEVIEVDVEKEYKGYILTNSGIKIPKISQTQFLGTTKEEAKEKCIAKMKEDLATKMKIVTAIQNRIDLVSAL